MSTQTKANERPIRFSDEMVRAILRGAKTQTREVVTYHNSDAFRELWDRLEWDDSRIPSSLGANFADDSLRGLTNPIPADYLHVACRPHPDDPEDDDGFWTRWRVSCMYEPGTRLWVREAWALPGECDDYPPSDFPGGWPVWYRADDSLDESRGKTLRQKRGRWRPSTQMPRWASRITLEVSDVRVERLQSISDEDARAEGFSDEPEGWRLAHQQFAGAWDSKNAKAGHSWESNPYVWVVSFRMLNQRDEGGER